MNLSERISAFGKLAEYLKKSEELDIVVHKAKHTNSWFTEESIMLALDAIRLAFLDHDKLVHWTSKYEMNISDNKSIALILAGNIPAVGFHDVLAVLISGHKALIKLSSKDNILIPFILEKLIIVEPRFFESIEYIERVRDFDAIIATGSNNSAVHFEHYFSKYPHIIRRNRKSIGVIPKDWTKDYVMKMGDDILLHFGLGCRNVSFLLIEESVDLTKIMEIWHERKEFIMHNKYKNNYDYNYTLLLMNQAEFLMNSALLLVKEDNLHSRIATVNYATYSDMQEMADFYRENKSEIQCIVAPTDWSTIVPRVAPGSSQIPSLTDYADNVDTLQFLTNIPQNDQ